MVHIPAQVRVSIWVTVRKVNGIQVKLCSVLKGQAIIILSIAVIVRLQRIDVLVQDLIRTEVFVAAECRRVLILKCALYPVCLVISNILAIALPAELAPFACVEERVDHGLHALGVGRVRLHEVHEVEAVGLVLARVLNSEVEPLSK